VSGRAIVWTVPAVMVCAETALFLARWWRGEAPAHVPEFFLVYSTGVYFDRVGTCWGMPVYRQRLMGAPL
jgi:hypothetical protein